MCGTGASCRRRWSCSCAADRGILRAGQWGMTQTSFTNLKSAATDLNLKINQLQNSAGVLEDTDQAALTDIEAASTQLLHAIDALNQDAPETTGHKAAVAEDKQVRPGETPAQHSARMAHTYPVAPSETPAQHSARVAAEPPKYGHQK